MLTDKRSDEAKALAAYRAEHGPGGIPADEVMAPYYATHGGKMACLVRSYRRDKGMTQGQLAKILKMPQSNVSQIEKGKRPVDHETAARLAKVFGVDVRVFF